MGCITQSQSLPFPVIENENPGRSMGPFHSQPLGGGRAGRQQVSSMWGFPPELTATRAASYWATLKAFAEGEGSLPEKDVKLLF